jgi:hypothetical protein
MEYIFSSTRRGSEFLRCGYHVLIVPGTGIVRDMTGINKAAEDYQARYFGAAQVQVVMDADDYDDAERGEIFQALIGPNVDVINAMVDVKVR